MSDGVLIGYRILKEDTVMVKNDYECAAWYERLLVKAGKYPIYAYRLSHYMKDGVYVTEVDWSNYIHYEGTIIDDYFGTLYCGVPISTYDEKKNTGKKTQYSQHIYCYSLAKAVLNGSGEYELLPEYKAESIDFKSSYDGEQHTAHHILKIC